MAVIVPDSNNPSYDQYLATANGFYRAEAHNLSCYAQVALTLTTARIISPTFANAGNLQGIVLAIQSTSSPMDRTITVRLQEAITVGSFDTATERVNIVGHGLTDGTVVCFTSTGTLPTGITSSTTRYYVINSTADDFQISTTSGGSAVGLSGTPTGTATCWATRTDNAMGYADVFGTYTTGTSWEVTPHNIGFVPFKFATPYAVDTTAGKWRFHIFQSGGTAGTWYLITSDNTNPFYVAWCDNQVSHTNDDTMIVVDKIIINKTCSFAGLLGTGETANSTTMVICRNTDYSEANVALLEWENPATASYTMTIKGNIWLGSHSGIRIGTAASPIASANQAVLTFTTPNVGTTAFSRIWGIQGSSSSTVMGMRQSFFAFGEIPALVKTTLASDAATGQAHLITTDSTGWVNGDTVVFGKQDVIGQGETSTYTVQSVSGTDITLTSNVLTNARKAGGTVVRTNGFGVKIQGTSNTAYAFVGPVNPSFFQISGVEFIDAMPSPALNSSYYYMIDDAAYRSQHFIRDCTVRFTGTTNSSFVASAYVAKDGFEIERVYIFRGSLCTTITGYANARLKSGYLNVYDCVLISNITNLTLTSGTSTKVDMQRCRFENSGRYGYLMRGLSCTYKDNTVWGIASTASTGYYAVGVGQLVNPSEISGNSVDRSVVALNFTAVPSINCLDTGFLFGQESANTIDIYFLGGSIIDYVLNSPTGSLTIDTTELPDVVPGSKLRIVDYNDTVHDDRVYTPYGIWRRCGYNLADTTVWTGSAFGAASAGQYSLKFSPIGNGLLSYDQEKTTGDIQGQTMVVTARIKINHANYYAGVHTLPTLRVVYDGNTEVSDVATATTADQQLLVSFTPTTSTASILIYVEGDTDATGTDADFYLGELIAGLPEGVSINTTRIGLWDKALPLPTISTIPVPGSVWNETASAYTTAGTMGARLNHADNVIGDEIE